eukprot:TRINITY_DN23591_c0_g2_i3.p1 TRINITY_DN23591_c0_g2~~TRINITY_DN23591_c0_g2_i3.p1  ORF type:complete len:1141 (-),score=110.02 TRINITY_DN23591_c0_g2_i3:2618-6040(-)
MAASLAVYLLHCLEAQTSGYNVLISDKFRIGSGSEDSLTTNEGGLKQPHYKNSAGQWRKITYSSDDWYMSLWAAGTKLQMGTPSITYTSNTQADASQRVTHGQVEKFNMTRYYRLSSQRLRTYYRICASSTASNVQLWEGATDDYLDTSDRPTKFIGSDRLGQYIRIYSTSNLYMRTDWTTVVGIIVLRGSNSITGRFNLERNATQYTVSSLDCSYALYLGLGNFNANQCKMFYTSMQDVQYVEDINECTTSAHNCHAAARCSNTAGSFTCTCNSGWSGDGVSCQDINECTTSAHNCHAAARCSNTAGSFTCTCNSGWSGDGVSCQDINECTTSAHNCHTAARSSNTAGSFKCTCNSGWSGDGVSCQDINECATSAHNCNAAASCSNTAGSFVCTCNSGWSGDGVSCQDIDECTTSAHNCHGAASCINTDGGYVCSCNYGWSGDGVSCVSTTTNSLTSSSVSFSTSATSTTLSSTSTPTTTSSTNTTSTSTTSSSSSSSSSTTHTPTFTSSTASSSTSSSTASTTNSSSSSISTTSTTTASSMSSSTSSTTYTTTSTLSSSTSSSTTTATLSSLSSSTNTTATTASSSVTSSSSFTTYTITFASSTTSSSTFSSTASSTYSPTSPPLSSTPRSTAHSRSDSSTKAFTTSSTPGMSTSTKLSDQSIVTTIAAARVPRRCGMCGNTPCMYCDLGGCCADDRTGGICRQLDPSAEVTCQDPGCPRLLSLIGTCSRVASQFSCYARTSSMTAVYQAGKQECCEYQDVDDDVSWSNCSLYEADKTVIRRLTRDIRLAGDYNTVVGGRKKLFLKECSTKFATAEFATAKCIDVKAGSLIITVAAADEDAFRAAKQRAFQDGRLELSSFGVLQLHVGKREDSAPEAVVNTIAGLLNASSATGVSIDLGKVKIVAQELRSKAEEESYSSVAVEGSPAAASLPRSLVKEMGGSVMVIIVAEKLNRHEKDSETGSRLAETNGLAAANVSVGLWVNGEPKKVMGLSEPVLIKILDVRPAGARCVFWNDTEQLWSTSGVSMSSQDGSLTCASTHLTLFNAIFEDIAKQLECANIQIVWNSLEEFILASWPVELPGIILWLLLGGTCSVLVCACVADSRQSWRDGDFVIGGIPDKEQLHWGLPIGNFCSNNCL